MKIALDTTKSQLSEALEDELRAVEAKINNAYWAFTRQARGKPPCLVVPEAYTRRTEIKARLRELKKRRALI